ncbi:MAG: HNH endonuclease signature motif containing protein [Candidatus Sedimenticola sp. (ex Thyasira tokunagai)]
MKQREKISDDLAADVMFASDRTCCVCRSEKQKVQIHHIDKDPSNNDIDNLAVICLYCHSDAHTNGAFVRNLTPEIICLYNTSWREIVHLRLNVPNEESGRKELAAEAFLEASLDCHYWKNHFMSLTTPPLPEGQPGQFKDVWDLMAELWIPKYSEEIFQRYRPLFINGLLEVQRRFDRLIQLFPDVLPHDFRAKLVRASRQLDVERIVYLSLPKFVEENQTNSFFYARFSGAIRVLRDIVRDSDERRELLMRSNKEPNQ